MKNLTEFLDELKQLKTQSDIEAFVTDEFNKHLVHFANKGCNINATAGFINKHHLQIIDIPAIQQFRILHFIFWGIKGNWDTALEDKDYFKIIQNEIEPFYKSAKSI